MVGFIPNTKADILHHSVKDFGAVGDGNNDDTSSIQAAIDWTAGANRGTIFFPLGTYKTTAPLTFNYDGNLSIRFEGEIGSTVIGTFNGFIFDRSLVTPNNTTGRRIFDRMRIVNGHATGGALRIGSSIGVALRDCEFTGHTCITTEDAVGVSSKNVLIQDCQFSLGNGNETGSNYIIIGGGGSIQGCAIVGAGTGVRAYGKGLHASGNRQERNDTAWLLGLDSGDNAVGLSGFAITSSTFEGNWTGFDLAGPCNGFYIGSHLMMGHDNTNAGVQTPSAQGTQYAVRVRADCATNGVIESISCGSWHEVACIDIANATSRTNLVLRNISATATGGGGNSWNKPTNAYTATLKNCNTSMIWTYTQLPTGGNVLEGDEFDISDSTTATWGANVTVGGGSNRVRVRYNGTNWTVVGK